MPPRSQEVAVREQASVPALASTPALDIDARDIQLPKLYVAQKNSKAVDAELVKPGQIFLALGAEDPDPQVLFDPKDGGEGVLFHVLQLVKGWSYSEEGGDLERWAYNDPTRHPDAWVTYTYHVIVPEVDEELPASILLTRTGAPTAKRINTLLAKNASRGPAWNLAFRLKTVKRENAKGTFFVAQSRQVDADPGHVELAANLYSMVAGKADEIEQTAGPGNEPAI